MAPIRVLIVDDSAFMRHALGRLLGEVPGLEVVGAATNGEEGLSSRARASKPDVITLDVEMPVLDGLGMLKRLMLETPTRVVMLSSRTTHNAQVTLDSLEFGAIDFVPKPSGSLSIDIGRVGDELVAQDRGRGRHVRGRLPAPPPGRGHEPDPGRQRRRQGGCSSRAPRRCRRAATPTAPAGDGRAATLRALPGRCPPGDRLGPAPA